MTEQEKEEQWERALDLIQEQNADFFNSEPGYLYEGEPSIHDYVAINRVDNNRIVGFIEGRILPDNIINQINAAYQSVWG